MSEYTGRRITPDEVEAAYSETGLKPARTGHEFLHDVRDGSTCACGLGAVYCRETGDRQSPAPWHVRQVLRLGSYYLCGYGSGFEGNPPNPVATAESELGYADGQAAAARVFGEVSA